MVEPLQRRLHHPQLQWHPHSLGEMIQVSLLHLHFSLEQIVSVGEYTSGSMSYCHTVEHSLLLLLLLSSADEDDNEGGPPSADEGAPSQGTGRANLMEAIRKAGGAGKAGLKNRKKQRKAKKAQQEASSGGEMWSSVC